MNGYDYTLLPGRYPVEIDTYLHKSHHLSSYLESARIFFLFQK